MLSATAIAPSGTSESGLGLVKSPRARTTSSCAVWRGISEPLTVIQLLRPPFHPRREQDQGLRFLPLGFVDQVRGRGGPLHSLVHRRGRADGGPKRGRGRHLCQLAFAAPTHAV